MEDLSRSYPNRLVPTSQEGGGMVYDNSPAMTAPGSTPVTPMKTPYGATLPFETPALLPEDEQKVAVSNEHGRIRGNAPAPDQKSGGGWKNSDETPAAGGWVKV
jgi:hypothetical protein